MILALVVASILVRWAMASLVESFVHVLEISRWNEWLRLSPLGCNYGFEQWRFWFGIRCWFYLQHWSLIVVDRVDEYYFFSCLRVMIYLHPISKSFSTTFGIFFFPLHFRVMHDSQTDIRMKWPRSRKWSSSGRLHSLCKTPVIQFRIFSLATTAS